MAAFDFAEYIEENFDFKRIGDSYYIDCLNPYCDDSWEMKKHLGITPEKQIGHCFK